MAIIDKNAHNWIDDSDENQFIGLTLPLILDNGEVASTKTTLEAIKQNVLNLLNTELGERVMQPNLGIMLKRFLFEPFSDDMVSNIQDSIIQTMDYWMPFILIKDINVKMSDNQTGDFSHLMKISIFFTLKQDESVTESVSLSYNKPGE